MKGLMIGLLVSVLIPPLPAQESRGNIVGKVLDTSGAVTGQPARRGINFFDVNSISPYNQRWKHLVQADGGDFLSQCRRSAALSLHL